MFKYFKWNEVRYNWSAVNLTWKQVGILINDVIPNILSPINSSIKKYDLDKINKLSNEKKIEIIKIICKIEDDEYILHKSKNLNDVKIEIHDLDIIVEKLLNKITIDVQNIS